MNVRLKIFFILFVASGILGMRAQNGTADSLRLALKNAKHDTSRCELYLALSEQIYMEAPDSALHLWTSVQSMAENNLRNLSASSPEYPVFQRHYAGALHNMGYLAHEQGKVVKALEYYNKSLKIEEELGDKASIATSLVNLGAVYKDQGDIRKALASYEKSLIIFESIGDKPGASTSLNHIGHIFRAQGDDLMALEFYKKSLKINETTGDKNGMAVSLNNIGISNIDLGNIRVALENHGKSLSIREEIGDKQGVAQSLNNIAIIYFDNGDMEKALEYNSKSLKIQEEIGNKKGMSFSLLNIGKIYLSKKKYNNALAVTLKSMQLNMEMGYPGGIRNSAKLLSNIYKATGDNKHALENYELFITMRDSINNEANRKASIRSQLKYEYEKQAAADSVSHAKESEIKNVQLQKQTAEIKAKKNQQYALFGGLGLVMFFAGFMFNRFKVTQKQKGIIEEQKKVVEEQKHLVEEKQKEVMDSIRYAQRIQKAQLPSEKYLLKLFERLKNN